MERDKFAYAPHQELLNRLHDVPLVSVVGVSGAGKTTLMQQASGLDSVYFVVSDTSRSPREGEVHGADYYFRSREYMDQKIAERSYATVAPSVTGDLYATAPEEYLKKGTPMMAVLASALPDFENTFPAMRTIAVVPPSFEAWRERLGVRKFSADQYQKRLTEARQSLGFVLESDTALCIINDDLSTAKDAFMHTLRGTRRESRIEVENRRAKNIAAAILRRLEAN
jgi:guanylate kinase